MENGIKKNEITKVLKIIKKDKSNVILEIMKLKKEKEDVIIIENNNKEIINLKDEQLIPIKIIKVNEKLSFQGPSDKLHSFDLAMFQNGKLIKSAKSKDIAKNLLKDNIGLTPKQIELEMVLGSFIENNFRIIHESKIRMKNRSHCYLRNANALSRERDKNCIFCQNQKDSINHILFECNKYKYYANKILKVLNKFFGLNLIFDERFLIILHKETKINIFQMINQRIFWNLRCGLIHEGATFDDTQWEKLIQLEVERFIMKEIYFSNNKKEIIEIWNSMIENIDSETGIAKIKRLFE